MAPIKSFVGKFAKTAFTVSSSCNRYKNPKTFSVATTVGTLPASSNTDVLTTSLAEMCHLFKASPVDLLYLSSRPDGGERGVCAYRPVAKGDVILSIPISSCFRDDEPPKWFQGDDDGGDEHDITDYERYNPSAWASRLAASILDMELNNHSKNDGEDNKMDANVSDSLDAGKKMWQSMLPDCNILRSSLPVHWSEEVLSNSKCTALDLAVDSAYFARATSVIQLGNELSQVELTDGGEMNDKVLQQKCHDALDVVQTRACRVERTCEDGVQWGPPLRILAPIFDFINHGSSRSIGNKGGANAAFGVEGAKMSDMNDASLVVRAVRDLKEGEEVLIDYGDSARPTWRCLTSYGFIPNYSSTKEESNEDQELVENVAELWMNGLRFEVDPHSVPYDLVEVAAAQALLDGEIDEDEEERYGLLTPSVARSIAKRATDSAFNLLLEPELDKSDEDWDAPDLVQAASLAAALRWSQYGVLLSFANNLERFSSQGPNVEP